MSRLLLAARPLATTGLAGKLTCFQEWDVKSWWDTLSLSVVLVGVVLVLSTFRDYGVTWDEDVHNWYGNFVLDYYHATRVGLPAWSGQLGSTYVIPVIYVPLLMITHVTAFYLLMRSRTQVGRVLTGEAAAS